MAKPVPSGDPRRAAPGAVCVDVVVLTMGNRPGEVAAAIDSALAQRDVTVRVIVVANGVGDAMIELPDDDRIVAVRREQNAGIPGGRNIGFEHARAPYVAFLDDDATFLDDTVLASSVGLLRANPSVGAVALRIVDATGETARRHVPRIGARDPGRSGPVTAFLGGAVVVLGEAFRDAGGYPAPFVYSMEETDLALRMIERGWRLDYDGRPAVYHPATSPGRHPDALTRTMRNRVWLAHRNLPWPVAVTYVIDWFVISLVRDPRRLATLIRAVRDGWRSRPGPRSPIRWRTVARLTRLGRPPII